jgi:hypothetical protein
MRPVACYRPGMASRVGAWIGGGVALVALALSLLVVGLGTYEPGVDVVETETGLIVGAVAPYSPASRDGITPGMIVVGINDVRLYSLPSYEYPEPDPATPDIVPDPILVGPSEPTPITMSQAELQRLAALPIQTLEVSWPGELATYSAEGECCIWGFYYPGDSYLENASLALLPGLAVLLLGIWWLDRGRGGESLRSLAVPVAAAVATPLLVQPLLATFSPPFIILAGLLTLAAMVPLALGLAMRIEDARERRLARSAIAVLVFVGAVTIVFLVTEGSNYQLDVLRWVAVGSIPPGLST